MNYSFTLLSTTADCDSLLAIANKNKEELEYRKFTLEHKREKTTASSVEIEADLQSVTAEIAAMETIIANLPDGEAKNDSIFKKAKLEYRKLLLTERKNGYGIVALLETEADIGCIDQQIQETDAFIAGVNERKGNL